MQDSAKSADEVLNSLIKYAKGQGEKGVNNLQKIKDYLGEENNAFLEMQILNKLFKESVVENDRASLRVFDSESFLSRVRELVGENELYERKIGKEFLEELSPSAMPKQISIDEFLNTLENFKNKENFLKHIEKDPKRKDYLNLIEPTLKEPDIAFKKLENGVEKEKFIKKFSDGKDFFYLLATKDNKETILTAFKTDKINTILKEFNADIIPTFIRQGSKGKAAGTTNEGIITQPLFKSKEAREFLELVEGFHKLYKNDASIAKNLVQGTSEKLSTSIATSAEGAIKQKVVKGAFDPIFRLLPDKILFGLFAKQIQGGALRYHLKKALSRSLNYDDFKTKLEKELKRTNFNSNTSRLIDEFMQNLDTFNAEKEAKLAKIREEQARIKEEERKRAEEIYQAQEANNLKDILEAEEKPLKDEFGVNFEGFKGKEAIEKLLEEQRGQVKGAFYKEGLGEIDLVWGEITDLEKHKGYGLAHILDKRKSEFVEQGASQSEAAQKAAEFAKNEISNIMQNGKIINKANEATRIETQDYRLILKQNWKGEPTKNKWLVTAYMKKEKGESISSSPFTKEDNLSLNSKESIAQKAKNDEVLEAEVIEEASLNEPMKFLEFQQRKLLTYIKENTPLRLLEHKKELKTRDILNFLEQSALNGKQKVFLMRNLERDLGKLEAQLKEAEEVGFKEAKNAVDDDFLKGYDEKIKQNIKSLEFENELIENPRPRGREPQDRYISLAYFMANFAQHYKLLDLKNPRTKEQIKLLENALKKQNIGYEVLENEPVAIRYFKKEGVKRQGAKQKTINKVDEYAKSEEFKALSEDKQEAILSLKNLEPSIMPSEISKDNLENILKHFNSKQDKARREFYAKLFNDTKENPHIVLEVKRENELRQEYIKAYQHKDTHDLYYIAITKDKDTINVTGCPITKIKDVINQIKNAEKVVWRQQGDQTHTALVSKETQNLESVNESIAQKAKSEKAEFESFKDKIKELYTKYEGLNHYDKSESQLRSKLLDEEIKPEIKKEFKNIIDKFKGADNKDKILRVIKENKEELSDYLAFHIALRKDIDIDGHGVGKVDFYDKSIRDFIKFRENKQWSEIDESKYRALAALENLSNKNTSLYFFFKDLNGKVGEIKTYPRIQDLLFYDLTLGYDLKNAVILSTKDKLLKEKLIEKLKAYIDKKIYADFLEYKIKDLESRNPKNSYFENYKDEKWDEEALKSFKKELEDLRANEKAQKLEAKGSEDIIFTDKKGKEHTLTKETQKAWLEAFNLKSLEEAYIPNLPRELKEALGKEIKLTKGSLYKIVEKGREKYIPQMKQTLQNPDFALRDRDNMLILAKQIEDKQYFTSVNLETKDYFISVSNAPKKENILKNKVENGAEILYQSPNAKSIFYTDTLLQTDKSSANKIDEDIIAQKDKSESEKEVLERQIPFIEAEIQKYEAKIASLDERIKKTQTRIQPYLDEINALQKQYDELYFTETRGEEANAKKWLKLEEIKAKQEELRKPYNDALFKFVFPHQRLKGKVQTEIQKLKFGLQDRALRLEEIQNEALNTSKAQKAWLEAFNLKSLEEAYIPNFKAEVKEAINRVLGGEEIKLTKGSLIKLIKEKRLKYLDRIKPTLENPHSVILQNDGALIFARDYGEEKYFTSVARNDSGEWIIRSNAPKSKNGLNNKILNGGKEIYNDQAASQINASNPYDDIANSNIKLDNESIAENADYLELVKEYGEENAKSIIKQKILGENIAQVLENEEEKFIYKKGDREFEFKIKDAMGQFEMQYDELNLKSDLNKSFLKALNKLKIGYEVLENEPVRIRYFKQEAKERKPKETKPSADKTLGQIQKDMSARLKELKAQAKENYERYKNEDKALQKELTNTKDLFKAFEKEFNETEGTILISRAKRRKNDAEGKVETSVFLGNELALRNALDRWERYSGYSEENALEVKERLELLRSYVKRLEKHREDIKAKREQLEQDYQQNEAARSKEMGVIGNYNILSNLKGVSENELYEPFLEKVGGYLSKADFYERHLPFAREEFQKLFNITPLEEFGTNYAEFYRDGKGAVEKLLKEAEDFKQRGEKGEFKGQVAGAFYKEGLGEIDLVWGDSKKGLSHILERRTQDFINQGLEKGKAEYKVRELLSEIPQILENGKILSQNNDKIELITDKYTLVLGLREDKKFIVTELIDKRNKKRLEAMQTGVGDSFTDEPLAKTPLSQNQQEIIPQQKIKFAMEKFNYDEKKAKDLLEWHKNSHALTKDENGLPKVFYHGTYSKFRVFRRVGKASQQGFFFTPSQKATEEYGDITLNTFLNIKNPFRADELKINKEADLQKWADILKLDYDKEKYESFKDLKTKLEKVKEATKKAGFKFHSASGGSVYVIDNKGRNRFINLEELDKENKRVVEAFKGLETEDIYFYYVVRNEFDLVLYALNKNDRYFHTSGRDEVKRVLEKLGYDGAVLNDTIITVFNSNQIKHIDNKGSFTDTKGNVTSKKPKNKEAEFSYFNEKSDNIYHSNPHLGAGLVGGVLNGVEQDENGNLSFDPVKFAMGFLGGAAGSKAVKESIKWRANKVKKAYPNIAKNNPTLMEQIAKRDLLTYAKNETQNALTRLLNKNKLFDSTKGLFAGEKALLNEAYAPHKARLEKAKELEGSGADEIEIWEKTGWYKDKDHKWKFEISQRGGELDLAKIKDKDSEAKLGEILKDDELFKAYPQLRDMSVKHVDLSGNYGFYYVPYNDIKLVRPHIQLDIDEIKTSPYKVKEVLYHEIQHAIQHKEQFAYGLSYMAETYERYLKQHGEVEARNIQERMKNPTKIHPHKTMDTDIEDTIAESTLSTEYSEAFSRKLEKSFLDESGRIAYKALIHKAEVLPQSLNLKGFKQMIFNNDKTKQLNAENALIKTPVGEVKVNVLRAFNHYMKNGKNGNHKENRQALNATFMPTLLEPKFVTRDEEGTMYYYKPFISKDKEYHITSIAVKKNGNLDYATSYNATENRLRQMIKHNELVYEKD
ncbi:hypothetical protein A0Z18_00370 [Campylobacter upsaliensis]|nr:hypothetical protein [Campylobacter upsaliensis]